MVRMGARILGATQVLANMDRVVDSFTVEATWVVGTNVEYSVYVEFGTYKMAAQPYLRPAVEAARRRFDSFLSNAPNLDKAIERIALFIEREAKRRCPVDTGNLRASIRAERVR